MPESVGGIERVIHELAVGMTEVGATVKVLALTADQNYSIVKFCGYEIHKVPTLFSFQSSGFSFKIFSVFRSLIKEVDIVHYHYPWPCMDLLHVFFKINIPSVVTYHSDIVRQKILKKIYWPLEKLFLKSVTKIVCSSPNYIRSSKKISNYLQKTVAIPFGIKESNYPQLPNSSIDKWVNIIGNKFFLFIGYLRYYKGLDVLLQTAQKVSCPLVIVGSGPLEMDLKRKVEVQGLTNIYFLGHLTEEDKAALLYLAYAMIFPSHLRSEAFGMALLEGLMFGKPLITAEIGTGTSFINLSGETGMVVPPSDPEALASAMTYLLEHPMETEEMGRNARRRFEAEFQAGLMVDRYMKLYRELL